jgi:type 1 glutamine amidotransferase
MFKPIFVLTILLQSLAFGLYAQSFKILHYSETSGFDHNTRQNSLAMLQNLGSLNNFTVDDDQTGAAFNTLQNLQQYAVVVFSNTSGDQILDTNQRANFEAYINNGGAIVGIHAATDTYRHSTANGNKTGTWDWYAETLGGSVQQSPNHTASNYNGTMDHVGQHFTTHGTPNPWSKIEEYYYWENGYLSPNITSVLQVRSTGGQSYDDPRPISWYRNLPGGGRSFYTALGHDNSNFTTDTAFENHIRDAVLWAAGRLISLPEAETTNASLYPNPAASYLTIELEETSFINGYEILNMQGQALQKGTIDTHNDSPTIAVEGLPNGSYFLYLHHKEGKKQPLRFTVLH